MNNKTETKTKKTNQINQTTSNNKNKYKLLIFDWDGTLMDSLGHIIECTRRVATHFGLKEPTLDGIRAAIGLPTLEYVTSVFPDGKNPQEMKECYINFYLQTDSKEKLFHGVPETLTALAKRGFQLAIATNKSHAGLQHSLELHNLHNFFATTRCGDDVFTKPQPEVIWGILQELQIKGEEALMIGDTEFDMEVAKNAKVDAVAASYGIRSKEQLLSYAPIACINDVKELLTLLKT